MVDLDLDGNETLLARAAVRGIDSTAHARIAAVMKPAAWLAWLAVCSSCRVFLAFFARLFPVFFRPFGVLSGAASLVCEASFRRALRLDALLR